MIAHRVVGKVAVVSELPPCDFCGEEDKVVEARFDFRTLNGSWANGCRAHWAALSLEPNELGTGIAQYLVTDAEVGSHELPPWVEVHVS